MKWLITFLANAFVIGQRPLTSEEISVAKTIFKNSIDYSLVRIATARVANTPLVIGNTIRVKPGCTMPLATFIHELMHVWQYQHHGAGYMVNSLYHQAIAWLKTGSRGGAYLVAIVPQKPISRYTAEQQAMLVQYFFFNRNNEQQNPEYLRLIDEITSTPKRF